MRVRNPGLGVPAELTHGVDICDSIEVSRRTTLSPNADAPRVSSPNGLWMNFEGPVERKTASERIEQSTTPGPGLGSSNRATGVHARIPTYGQDHTSRAPSGSPPPLWGRRSVHASLRRGIGFRPKHQLSQQHQQRQRERIDGVRSFFLSSVYAWLTCGKCETERAAVEPAGGGDRPRATPSRG